MKSKLTTLRKDARAKFLSSLKDLNTNLKEVSKDPELLKTKLIEFREEWFNEQKKSVTALQKIKAFELAFDKELKQIENISEEPKTKAPEETPEPTKKGSAKVRTLEADRIAACRASLSMPKKQYNDLEFDLVLDYQDARDLAVKNGLKPGKPGDFKKPVLGQDKPAESSTIEIKEDKPKKTAEKKEADPKMTALIESLSTCESKEDFEKVLSELEGKLIHKQLDSEIKPEGIDFYQSPAGKKKMITYTIEKSGNKGNTIIKLLDRYFKLQ